MMTMMILLTIENYHDYENRTNKDTNRNNDGD